jgi:hypothetical protein
MNTDPAWSQLFARAGEASSQGAGIGAAAKLLLEHGLHLSTSRMNASGASAELTLVTLGPLSLSLEHRLAMRGLAAAACAVPIANVEGLRVALWDRRAAFYTDLAAFMGEALVRRPRWRRFVRGLGSRLRLGSAAVAPYGERHAVCVAGLTVRADIVEPLSAWALTL